MSAKRLLNQLCKPIRQARNMSIVPRFTPFSMFDDPDWPWKNSPFGDIQRQMFDIRKKMMHDVKCDGAQYEIGIDVPEFEPNEVKVDIDDRQVTVSASHVDRDAEHGTYASRSFERVYTVPKGVNLSAMIAQCHNGRLIVKAPVIEPIEEPKKNDDVVEIEIQRKQS